MAHSEPPPNAAHDLLLVLGVAALGLGAVMVSQGVLPSQSAAHSVPPPYAALGRVERLVPASDAGPVVTTPPAARVPTMFALTTSSGATRVVAACPAHLGQDHDLRLVLLTMARQRRRTLHPTAHFVPPDKQDIPASVLALVKGSSTHAEATPPAARLPTGPGC